MSEEKRPTRVKDEELWKMRALEAQRGRLEAEIQLSQKGLEDIARETQELITSLKKEYGQVSHVNPDGTIAYLSEASSPKDEKPTAKIEEKKTEEK